MFSCGMGENICCGCEGKKNGSEWELPCRTEGGVLGEACGTDAAASSARTIAFRQTEKKRKYGIGRKARRKRRQDQSVGTGMRRDGISEDM